jgi:hypothetical protein
MLSDNVREHDMPAGQERPLLPPVTAAYTNCRTYLDTTHVASCDDLVGMNLDRLGSPYSPLL